MFDTQSTRRYFASIDKHLKKIAMAILFWLFSHRLAWKKIKFKIVEHLRLYFLPYENLTSFQVHILKQFYFVLFLHEIRQIKFRERRLQHIFKHFRSNAALKADVSDRFSMTHRTGAVKSLNSVFQYTQAVIWAIFTCCCLGSLCYLRTTIPC